MKLLQSFTDKAAISLSFICTLHCLAFPVLIALLPSLAAMPLEGETLHRWLLIAVIPTSIYALTMGCRQHKRYTLLAVGLAGLTLMIMAVTLVEMLFEGSEKAEFFEKSLTVIGSILIAFGHFKNYRLCQHQQACCPEETAQQA